MSSPVFPAIGLRRVAVAGILVLAQVACAPKVEVARQWDPATKGVEVVTSPTKRTAPTAFRLADQPLIDISADQSLAEKLHSGTYFTGTLLANGSLAMTDVDQVRIYDSTGVLQKVIKRAGADSFQYLIGICRTRGDTLIVDDANGQRIGIVDPVAGTVVRTMPVLHGHTSSNACFSDGTFLTLHWTFDSLAKVVTRNLARLRTDGTVASLLWEKSQMQSELISGALQGFVAAGDRFYLSDPQYSEVRSFDTTGALKRIARVTDSVVEISSVTSISDPNAPTGPVTRLPFYEGIIADPDGLVWMHEPKSDGAPEDVWTALGPDGKMIGNLRILQPGGGLHGPEVRGFASGKLLMMRTDERGITHMQVYRLLRTAP